MNNVVLIGRLTRDPELRYIPNSGTPVSTFTLAVDKQLSRDKKQEMEARNQPTADFIRIVVWGKMAETCANYLVKGRLVGVQGRIQTGSYDDKDGKRVYTTDIVANNVEFLEWGDNNNRSSGFDSSGSDFPDIEGFHPIDNDDIPF
ncbi:single-stranded DNA-binding protein [Lachnospiraceae bacterium NSJ-29]|uniref:Single-stranded DNA-binding protein n=2 Tax=Wansuia hejianensis TaxID=2763667 RepID=A0A926IM94_9FIRM|nr:single-stranded DNA-binding protein [Wansuia hejianensis]MBC8590386.1 single-stranded DNA-binding protein [Wansuia hejianensis]